MRRPPSRPAVRRLAFAAAAALVLQPQAAHAHAAERGFVLLLPTDYYLFGGGLAVAISFLALALLPPAPLLAAARRRLPLAAGRPRGRALVSGLSFLVLCGLVLAGFTGSRDPLSNPLPLTVWTLLWVGLTVLQGLVGNLWAWLNPWYGPWRLASRLARRLTGRARPPLRLPRRLGHAGAIAFFLAFAWFELVDPAPDDPERLARAVAGYWLVTFAGTLAFGYRAWTRRVEFLSVFFAMIARLAVVETSRAGRAGRRRLALCLPGAQLSGARPLPVDGALFLLLALSTVSFDGLMATFAWLAAIGVNPLEFPGRSAVMAHNTGGLLAMFAALAGAFFAAVALGARLAGGGPPIADQAGLLVWSIVPIALAYHVAHYLVVLAVNGQYALAALSDPLARGWNLFGTAALHVRAGIAIGADSAWIVWNLQAAAIVGGHVLAVVLAHLMAFRLYGDARRAALSQLPLAALMVAYTTFGLWLLAAPTGL